MDNLDQSIIVDEEFCDKNLFSLYQNSIRQNAKLNPKINLQDYQLNTINRYHNIVYLDQSNIKSTQNIIINWLSLKKQNLQMPVYKELQKSKEPLNRHSTELDLKALNLFLQRYSGLAKLNPIGQEEKLVNPISLTQRFIITNTQELPVVEICSNKNAEQKPASFRYNDLQLNQYLEEFKLLKQETLTSVILPHVSLKTNRTQFNQTQATNRYQTNNNYYNNIIPKNKVQQRQTNLESQNQTLTLSGWSDYSNQ